MGARGLRSTRARGSLSLEIQNRGFSLAKVGSFGWYDLTITVEGDPGFEQQLAGHVETGSDSMTDPALGM